MTNYLSTSHLANVYRRFTEFHLACLRLVCQVYGGQYPGKRIYQSGQQVVATAAYGR